MLQFLLEEDWTHRYRAEGHKDDVSRDQIHIAHKAHWKLEDMGPYLAPWSFQRC